MDKQTLIDNLNDDLAGELSAIIQYITYAAKATGPYRPQLVQFFLAEVVDEQAHAQFLANKIVALGGEPVTVAHPVPVAKTNHEMLEKVLAAEIQAGKTIRCAPNKPMPLVIKGWQYSLKIWCATKWVTLTKRPASCATGR